MAQVVLTVDTEPDNVWANHHSRSLANVRELRRLRGILESHGARATYLVTYRILQDAEALGVLQELAKDGAEIGAHLHAWETPPFFESEVDTEYPSYNFEIPLGLFEEKLVLLTDAIATEFGSPTSYRAGRWGLAPEHLPVLEKLGYQVDTSVTPLINWSAKLGVPREHGGKGGSDYRLAPWGPYCPDHGAVCQEGSADLVEVPVTVGLDRRTPAALRRRYGALPEIAKRVLRKLGVVRAVWALPGSETLESLLTMFSILLDDQVPILNMTFHSSELLLKGSPFSQTREEVDAILRKIDGSLRLFSSRSDCSFATLTDAAVAWKKRERSFANSLLTATRRDGGDS